MKSQTHLEQTLPARLLEVQNPRELFLGHRDLVFIVGVGGTLLTVCLMYLMGFSFILLGNLHIFQRWHFAFQHFRTWKNKPSYFFPSHYYYYYIVKVVMIAPNLQGTNLHCRRQCKFPVWCRISSIA